MRTSIDQATANTELRACKRAKGGLHSLRPRHRTPSDQATRNTDTKRPHTPKSEQCPVPSLQCPVCSSQLPDSNSRSPVPIAQCPVPSLQCTVSSSQSPASRGRAKSIKKHGKYKQKLKTGCCGCSSVASRRWDPYFCKVKFRK